ncbi:MAG: FtsX-like permease family protein, partial [Moraxellaceae bacterium]|nr:FtsX-like permease family protein [Moraxellaceae bacterium]
VVAAQRSAIGLMKAFGYRDRDVIGHYLKLTAAIAALGLLLGGAAGTWLGREMAELYMAYYHFPFLVFRANPADYAVVAGVALAAVLGGAALAVRRAAMLNPAEAMTPTPPPDYSRAAGARLARLPWLDQQTRMILRQILRWPGRAALTVTGVAASGALLISAMSSLDAMDVMIETSFAVANRHDISVTFVEPRPARALFDLARQPGVLAAEPYRAAPAQLRFGHLETRVALVGAPLDVTLSRMVDDQGTPVSPPPGGLLLTKDLAQKLGARPGDVISVQITEGRRQRLDVPIAAVTTSYVGSGARMNLSDLNRLLGEGPQISGAWLLADPSQTEALYARLKAAPAVAGVGLQALAARQLTAMLDEALGTAIFAYVFFAGLIAVGVVYNTVRISFVERRRELATLRVLGFSRGAVSYILLGEVALLTLLALPVGAAAGALLT